MSDLHKQGIRSVYLAGPMTGIPQFNFPAFIDAATRLRNEYGLNVENPAEMDDPKDSAMAWASEDGLSQEGLTGWARFLKRDLIVVCSKVDGIVALPNWEDSVGANLEIYVCGALGMPVFSYPDLTQIDLLNHDFINHIEEAEARRLQEQLERV